MSANAELYGRGNGMIYDDVLDITWLLDANIDGTEGTSLGDLLLLERHLLGAASLSTEQAKTCDINYDGQVSIADMQLLQKSLTLQ